MHQDAQRTSTGACSEIRPRRYADFLRRQSPHPETTPALVVDGPAPGGARRGLLPLAGALLASLVTLTATIAEAQTTSSRPNILLVLSDDHSAPHAGCYGDPNILTLNITPNLDRLAAEGVCFDRAYTTAPQCAPSRMSIFAGRNPVDIGVTRFAQPPRADVAFFTDLLRDAGYWVGLEGRDHHLGGRGGDPRHIRDAMAEAGLGDVDSRFDYVNTFNSRGKTAQEVGSRFGQTLDRIPRDKPFFLYFGFKQPHRTFYSDHSDIDSARLILPPDFPDTHEAREDYAAFLSDVRELDRGFGAIMAELAARGLDDNTIVVFMGDNGESLWRGKGTLYERGNRVPLIVRWPGVARPGTHSRQLVSALDLSTTFLDAAGVPPARGMSGLSLKPLLESGAPNGRRFVFSERGYHPGPITLWGLDLARAVTGERYKLIYLAQPGQPYTPQDQGGSFRNEAQTRDGPVLGAVRRTDEDRLDPAWLELVKAHASGDLPPLLERLYFQNPRPIFQLFDLQEDPFELTNLSGRPELASVESSLREELDRWMVRSGDYLPLPSHAFQETPPEAP